MANIIEIEKMTNRQILKELSAYKQQIEDIGCYGMKDLVMRRMLEDEAIERGILR